MAPPMPAEIRDADEQARHHRARAAAFTEARDLLYGLEDPDAGDFITVAEWLLTGNIDALLRRDAQQARDYGNRAGPPLSPDAATWSPRDLDPYGTGDGSYPDLPASRAPSRTARHAEQDKAIADLDDATRAPISPDDQTGP